MLLQKGSGVFPMDPCVDCMMESCAEQLRTLRSSDCGALVVNALTKVLAKGEPGFDSDAMSSLEESMKARGGLLADDVSEKVSGLMRAIIEKAQSLCTTEAEVLNHAATFPKLLGLLHMFEASVKKDVFKTIARDLGLVQIVADTVDPLVLLREKNINGDEGIDLSNVEDLCARLSRSAKALGDNIRSTRSAQAEVPEPIQALHKSAGSLLEQIRGRVMKMHMEGVQQLIDPVNAKIVMTNGQGQTTPWGDSLPDSMWGDFVKACQAGLLKLDRVGLESFLQAAIAHFERDQNFVTIFSSNDDAAWSSMKGAITKARIALSAFDLMTAFTDNSITKGARRTLVREHVAVHSSNGIQQSMLPPMLVARMGKEVRLQGPPA